MNKTLVEHLANPGDAVSVYNYRKHTIEDALVLNVSATICNGGAYSLSYRVVLLRYSQAGLPVFLQLGDSQVYGLLPMPLVFGTDAAEIHDTYGRK